MRADVLYAAKVKAARYCAYQERSQQEVRNKLYKLGLFSDEVECLLSELIAENFINEERFAVAFTRGRFRLKHWGRIKIINELKLRGISKNLISIAIKEIDPAEYLDTLQKLIGTKKNLIYNKGLASKQQVANYLIGKGYEPELVWDYLHQLGD